MAEQCWRWVDEVGEGWGWSTLAPEGHRSPTVTAIRTASNAPKALVAEMAAHGWTIGSGYGKLKESTIRIGHMGDHTPAELTALLGQLQEIAGG